MGLLADIMDKFDLFSNLPFTILWDQWMPTDIEFIVDAILAVLFGMAVVGFVRKWIPLS